MVDPNTPKVVKEKPEPVKKAVNPRPQWRPKRKKKGTRWPCPVCDTKFTSVGLFWLHVKVREVTNIKAVR